MAHEFGHTVKATLFGQSHGPVVGVLVEGLPAGETIDRAALQAFLNRRRPGLGLLTSARQEADTPEFLSGLRDDRTCGMSLCAILKNTDARSGDYAAFRDTPRPGHADYTAWVKWGENAQLAGGGPFSGRLTAPLCVAGGIAVQLLARRGIRVGAHLERVRDILDEPFPLRPTAELFDRAASRQPPTLDQAAGARMRDAILAAAQAGDSLGGVVECAVTGLPAGLGDAGFGGVESRLAAGLFGIPAVKGVEFGAGFAAAAMTGRAANDPFAWDEDGRVVTTTNHCGGILGGVTDGMPLVLRAAFKPTPSIALPQQTVRLSDKTLATVTVSGRHDPCCALRAVPVVEAVTALAVLDLYMEEQHGTH